MMPHMLRALFSAIFLLILSTSLGLADDGAKSLYDQGKYQQAYEELQKSGLKSAQDYYNAGNCLYKLGRLGQALGYFEKANALAPNDPDIRYNLSLSERALEKAGSAVKDQSFWMGSVVPIARRVPEPLADTLLALSTFAVAVVAFRAKRKSLRFAKAVAQPPFLVTLATWLLVATATTAVFLAHQARLAAVVADVSVGRSGPNDSFTELFKLPAGTTVELTGESRDGWQQVRFSLGNVGWIVEKDLLTL
ncbi:MAG: tetratricopeptide repeat protein [Deltaproteobacteria bacterium]|nr:tetratricopeptide repeat protein [Deltaproteobacteria bacterium]